MELNREFPPDVAYVHFMLGQLNLQRGDTEAELAGVRRAVELEPESSWYRQALEQLEGHLGNPLPQVVSQTTWFNRLRFSINYIFKVLELRLGPAVDGLNSVHTCLRRTFSAGRPGLGPGLTARHGRGQPGWDDRLRRRFLGGGFIMDNCRRSGKRLRFLLACLALWPWLTLVAQEDQPGGEFRTISVDCTAGESIEDALRLAAPSSLLGDTEWLIEIQGVCEENVVLRGMTNVTLRGTDPERDGIMSVGEENLMFPHSSAVYITDANEIRIENLRLTGWRPLRVLGSANVRLMNCALLGEGPISVALGNSDNVAFTDTTISSPNQFDLMAYSSYVSLTRTTLYGGVIAFGAADVALANSTVAADRFGIYSAEGSWVGVQDSRVESTAFVVYTDAAGYVSVETSEVAGCILSAGNASVSLRGTTQTAMPSTGWPHSNLVAEGSMLNLWQESHLLGPIDIYEFSNVVVQGGSTVFGDLFCNQGSDAFCEDLSNIGHAYGCPSTPGFAATESTPSSSDCRPDLSAIRRELRSLIEEERLDSRI